MKKGFLLAVIIVAGLSINANKATAQSSANATLNVQLSAVQSIKVNSPVVNISISQPDDYLNGKSSGAIDDHLEVTSTGLYTISAKASGALSNGVAANDIPLSALTITPTFKSSATALTGEVYNTLAGTVSTIDQAFIKSSGGTTNAKYKVEYALSSGTGGSNLINRPAGAYVAVITYTIAPN